MMMNTITIIMATNMMKTMIMVLMPIVSSVRMINGFVMSHGDHNHYFFKKDLTPEQIKAAQDHLRGKTPVKPSPAHDDDHDEEDHAHHHGEDHAHGFDANSVISEDAAGFIMTHGDHNHYFFKKDLTPEQIKAAQDHLRGKTSVTPSPSHDDHDEEDHDHLMMITMKKIMITITVKNMAMVLMPIASSVRMSKALS